MFREPKENLEYKFIVPGSVYNNTLWDWDSWLTNIALSQFVNEDIKEYEIGCILNSLNIMDSKGRVPVYQYPGLSKENYEKWGETNIHKPCLNQHAAFIVKKYNGDAEWLRPHFSKLCKFVDYYNDRCRHEATGLFFWIDDAAIGVDNDPCTYYRPYRSSGSILLNCFMYKELLSLCYIGDILGVDVSAYKAQSEDLCTAIRTHCYDEKDAMYYSVDFNLFPVNPEQKMHSGAPRNWDCLIQRIGCWSSFLALWAGIATPEQAKRIVKENLLDKDAFWAPYGVRSLSKYEKMYQIRATGNPSCWLGPIWGIANYMVWKGLLKYGFLEEAKELAEKTVKLFENDITESGELHEYYDPESGAPIMNPGFQNWNLLSINMKAWLDGENVVEEF
jgi:putative isomerase